MVDLSNLKLVEEVIEVADDASYADAQEFPPPPPEGTYLFIQGKPTFSANSKGFLGVAMDHVITGGDQDGKKLNFDRISDKPFERSGVKVSMASDHIRAVYAPGDRPVCRTHADFAAAIEAAEGKSFKAAVVWEGGCNHADTPQECDWADDKVYRVKGERNFPGGQAKCTVCGKAVEPRAKINRRIARG
jgi:hypothetical protein